MFLQLIFPLSKNHKLISMDWFCLNPIHQYIDICMMIKIILGNLSIIILKISKKNESSFAPFCICRRTSKYVNRGDKIGGAEYA